MPPLRLRIQRDPSLRVEVMDVAAFTYLDGDIESVTLPLNCASIVSRQCIRVDCGFDVESRAPMSFTTWVSATSRVLEISL